MLILVLAAKPVTAQNITSVSLTSAGYLSDHPEGGPIGLGVALAVDRQRTPWTYRAVLTGLNTVVTADDIALCHLLPDESCLPDSVFPASLWTLEGLTLVRPIMRVPVSLLTGFGLALPVGRRAGTNGSDVSEVRASVRGTWRVGGELQFGRGARAVRLQLSRSGYSNSMLSLTGLVTLQLQFSL